MKAAPEFWYSPINSLSGCPLPGFCPLADDRAKPEYWVSVWHVPKNEGFISFLVHAHRSIDIFTYLPTI
jgi:hypothetical protein